MPSIHWLSSTNMALPAPSSNTMKIQKVQISLPIHGPKYLDPENRLKGTQVKNTLALARASKLSRQAGPKSPYPCSDKESKLSISWSDQPTRRLSTSEKGPKSSISWNDQPTFNTLIRRPSTSVKQLPTQPKDLNRRRTHFHIKRLQEMCPDPVNPWLDPGPPKSPQTNKNTTSKEQRNCTPPSPAPSPSPANDNNNNKAPISNRLTPLDLGEPAMNDEFEYSHLERNFDGKKMLWERGDWEENVEEAMREEEAVREKRRRERKERVRSGPLTKAQRKWRGKMRREGKMDGMDEVEEGGEEIGEGGERYLEE